MVSHLADRLVERYTMGARRLLDPFCGSCAVLVAAQRRGIPVSGIDINPMAGIFASVKLKGFDPTQARSLLHEWTQHARRTKRAFPVNWPAKHFWFTRATLAKLERLRFVARELCLHGNKAGLAVLLSFGLAVRLCSKADQRSPKPFISKQAKESRSARHFDPFHIISSLFDDLCALYGDQSRKNDARFILANLARPSSLIRVVGKHSHIITSPPYLNAQDYYRNFKLELFVLEELLPFHVNDLREAFIGTERGALVNGLSKETAERNLQLVPQLKTMGERATRLASVVHRYLHDMDRAFDNMKECLDREGSCVIVCGDNLVGGFRIQTWKVLQRLLEARGFRLFDRFTDQIGDRLLPPKRCGHKGLIKEEVISAYRLS
jgi:hypothetical protein